MDSKLKKTYPSSAQKLRLFSLIQEDEELRGGKFSATFSRKEAERRWIKIAEEVNAIGGASKTWQEWKKTWQDYKTKTKKKQTLINRASCATGGGPPPPPLSEEEEIILKSLPQSAISGHHDSQESVVEFFDDIDLVAVVTADSVPSLCQTVTSASSPQDLQTPVIVPPPAQFKDDGASGRNKENKKPVGIGKGKKKTAARRLEESIEIANKLQKTLADKNMYKKKFYEDYITEMKKQTEALFMIANNLKK